MIEEVANRLKRIETALSDQRVFIHRVPDPDTRERAEGHLITLVQMRDEILARLGLISAQAA